MAPRRIPAGGPKPDKLMRDALALELAQDVKLSKNEKVKKLRLVARSLVANAIEGDTAAISVRCRGLDMLSYFRSAIRRKTPPGPS